MIIKIVILGMAESILGLVSHDRGRTVANYSCKVQKGILVNLFNNQKAALIDHCIESIVTLTGSVAFDQYYHPQPSLVGKVLLCFRAFVTSHYTTAH